MAQCQDDFNYFYVIIVQENNEECCILEVDLKYTKEFHGKHNDHLFAPEEIYLKMECCQNITGKYKQT